MIAYREFRPSAPLARHVECYWVMAGAPGAGAPIERILPDGCVEVVLHLGEPFRVFRADGRSRAQPQAFVVGPSPRFLLIQPPPRITTFGIRFRPAGAPLLLAMPLNEIAGQSAPLDAVIGTEGSRLRERVGNADGPDGKVRAAEAVLLDRLRRMRARTGDQVRSMVRQILRSRGLLPVTEIARQAGLSPRSLERQFLTDVGLAAKVLSRLVRFQAVLGATARRERVEWAHVAIDCGYSDQAHLIREFRAFSGETPRTLQESQGQLSRNFTAPDRLRAFFKTD